ncbi:GNAT family N-acetyltransferase [Gracilibacillus sp. YIM 98692]|uniref:GNAT family N-acetyltransferase n=1 Tax=Gracilibacillus sp. YIM 98692 TaxID=2663532 RepID=UPI0013D39C4B|nr:GNAT family N-acetyltransferase [Gracilibacillus sp. YIM 98692]
MIHHKTYLEKQHLFQNKKLLIQGPVHAKELHEYKIHHDLDAFRPPLKQLEALIDIATDAESRIIIALDEDTIIGYVIFLFPDPIERWSTYRKDNLLELGAIEIAPDYRGAGIGSRLIQLAMSDPNVEHYIVISTEYYWHWDIHHSKLSIWDYRKLMERMMNAGGLKPAPTNDPEIMAHPANCLMMRIGKYVSKEDISLFDQIRFL